MAVCLAKLSMAMGETEQGRGDGLNDSLAEERLRDFMYDEPQLEALEISQKNKQVRFATVGEIDEVELRHRIELVLREMEERFGQLGKLHLSSDARMRVRSDDESLLIEKPTCPTAAQLMVWREVAWPSELRQEDDEDEWREMAVFAAICGAAGLTGYVLGYMEMVPQWVSVLCYVIAMLVGGWDAAQDTWQLLKKRQLDIHFLMLAVAVGASSVGAWGEGALLLFLFSSSGAMEHFALYRTRREINSLFTAAPKEALVVDENGAEHALAVDEIQPGAVVKVRPGDVFPLDAEIISGETAADESNLTGEATPVQKQLGDEVYGGTLNLWGAVKAIVRKRASESSLQKIIRLIQHAQASKAPSQSFTDRFGSGYTVLVLSITTAMFFVWWLGFGVAPFESTETSYSAFYRAMALLVVVSPCALVLSIPSAILAAIAWGAKHGVLFRGGAAVEKLAEIDVVALDKTGTLTTGALQVEELVSYPAGHENRMLELACALEANSTHPIARAIIDYGKSQQVAEVELKNFQSLTGMGVRGVAEEGEVMLGRRDLLLDGPLSQLVESAPEPPVGHTEVWMITPEAAGRFLLRDEIRSSSRSVLASLKHMGVHPAMLTGDRIEAAHEVANELGLEEADVHAGLFPEDKVALIQRYTSEGRKVAMVGDGVNDAPSLAAAYVSVAMGGRGSDAALEQSEVVLMNDRIEGFLDALALSKKARRIIRQNLVISLGTVILMLVIALFGALPLSLGVFAHEGSTVLVCLNSLRLLFSRS